jgi:hypothetical protein
MDATQTHSANVTRWAARSVVERSFTQHATTIIFPHSVGDAWPLFRAGLIEALDN